MTFLADSLQNITNVLHSVGVATPEMGWTEANGGVSSNQPVTYKLPTSAGAISSAPGSNNGVNWLGVKYDANAQPVFNNSYFDPSTYAGGGGGGDGSGDAIYQQQAYAQQQAQAKATANAQLMAGFNNQKANIYGTANDAATNLQGGYGQSILDTIKGFTRAQEGIDQKNVQNESSRIQGGRDILSMIGRGVQSGGVRLAQGNAGSSSAAQAIANAYAQLGQGQMSKVGNQFAQNADTIGLEQKYLSEDQAAAPDKFKVQIEQNVNSIVASARDQFAQLDAAMANASLPDRIAIEQEKESVRQQVLGKLGQYDGQLRSGVGGIKAADRGTNIASANTRLSAGQADPNLFNYTTQAPAQMQGTGPSASTLPIFTYNSKNKQSFA